MAKLREIIRTRTAEDVDTGNSTPLIGCAASDDLGIVGESGSKVIQKGKMVCISMISVEPCVVGQPSYGVQRDL